MNKKQPDFKEQTHTMRTLRTSDNQSETAVSQFLDKYFYPKFVRNFHRNQDRSAQLKGIDVTFDYKGKHHIVDEKTAAHYVNKNLPTFAFELDFIARNGDLHEGWFFDSSKKTEYYLLSWIWATKERYFSCEDITKLDISLVNRAKIHDMLSSFGFTKQSAVNVSKNLRFNSNFGLSYKSSKPFWFYYTERLAEKPINIIIRRKVLQELSDLNYSVSKPIST